MRKATFMDFYEELNRCKRLAIALKKADSEAAEPQFGDMLPGRHAAALRRATLDLNRVMADLRAGR